MTRTRALLLATALAVAFTLTGALPASAATYTPTTWTELRDNVAAAAPGDRIVLGANITSSGVEGLVLSAGADLELDLNGHTLNILPPPAAFAGVQVDEASSLTISATGGGILHVTGGENGSGIGGTLSGVDAGTITITGGTILANGGFGGAGIGGAGFIDGGGGGTVTITGGTVTATGAGGGAGIGGGGGSVTITGGTVTATGAGGGAGIGGGEGVVNGGGGGSVTITGGTVTATADGGGAGIGGGGGVLNGGGGGSVTITGGTVTATAGGGGAGIGGGEGVVNGGGGGSVTITGGTITATGGPVGGSGIGGGAGILGIGGSGGPGVDVHGTATAGSHTTGGDGVGDPIGGLGATLSSTVTPVGVSYTATTTPASVTVGPSVYIQFHYLVSFNTGGGTAVSDQTVDGGDTVTAPADPTRDGFQFTGWRVGDASGPTWDFTTPVTSPLTLAAGWQPLLAATGPDVAGMLSVGVLLLLVGGALIVRRPVRGSTPR